MMKRLNVPLISISCLTTPPTCLPVVSLLLPPLTMTSLVTGFSAFPSPDGDAADIASTDCSAAWCVEPADGWVSFASSLALDVIRCSCEGLDRSPSESSFEDFVVSLPAPSDETTRSCRTYFILHTARLI